MKNTKKTGKIIHTTIATSMIFFMRSIAKTIAKETPENILERNFSSGEIDAYEYNQKKRQLQRDEDLKVKRFLLSRM